MLAAANEILLELWDGSPEGGQIATIQQLYQVIEFVADAQQSHHKSSSFGGTGGRGGGTQYTVLELSYCAGSDLLTVIEQIQLGERDDADFTTAQGGTGGKDHRTAREELVSQLIREGELRGSLGMGLAEEKVKKLVYPLVQTLACLHEDDFTHNDIKPENIMLCRADRSRFDDSDNDHEEVAESGCDQYLALIDFECARHNCLKVDIKEDPPHGTVAYTAPEMILCVLFARFHNLVHRLNEFGENEPDAELSGQRNTADHERTCATTGADDGEDAAGRRGQLLETMECSNSTKSSILSLQAKLEDEYQEFKKANEKLSLRANDCWGLGSVVGIGCAVWLAFSVAPGICRVFAIEPTSLFFFSCFFFLPVASSTSHYLATRRLTKAMMSEYATSLPDACCSQKGLVFRTVHVGVYTCSGTPAQTSTKNRRIFNGSFLKNKSWLP